MKLSNKLIVLVLAAATLWSCEDQLSTTPFDSIDSKSAFKTVSDLNDGALGAYGTISGENIYAINSLMTDNLRRASSNTGQGMQVFNHNIIANDGTVEGAWLNAYVTIDRINRVITAAETIEGENSSEVDEKRRIVGEMIALRAYQHFDLFRIFASYSLNDSELAVPYMTVSQIGKPARDTKGDFFAQLLADVNEAETILGSVGGTSNSRINLSALQGLRARIALYREDWPTAIDYATRVIDNNSLTPRSEYAGLWDDSIQGEVIFKLLRLTPSDGTIDIFERSGNDDTFFFASNEVSSLYDEAGGNDVRFSTFFTREAADQVRITKYNKRAGQKNTADIKMMRVSEMYLIRAEAYAQPGPQQNLTAAESDIQELRANRYDTPPATSFADANNALDTVYLERRLELIYEGHRFFDLKRANLPVERIAADIDGATTTDFLASDSFKFVFPIPQSEVFANENIEQNPGY